MKIEIIIPAYNCRKTLGRTLASLAAQSDDDFCVHVVDDHSTERLDDIIAMYPQLNIRLTRNPENLGCGMTRQVGIDANVADYIAFVDSDDILMPYAVETWRAMAESSPEIDIFHSYFYEQTRIDDSPALLLKKDGFTWCHGKLYKVALIRKYDIRNSADVWYADDVFFNSMCTELGRLGEIHLPLYIWMNNPSSITRSPESQYQQNAMYDFIRAIRISMAFVRRHGVDRPTHMDQTLSHIYSRIQPDDARSQEQLAALLAELDTEGGG